MEDMKWFRVISLGFAVCVFAPSAFADSNDGDGGTVSKKQTRGNDPCLSLNENPIWNQEIGRMLENLERKNYDAALQNVDKLNAICDRSPILNYSIARIYQKKGEEKNALKYFKRATVMSTEFSVDIDILEMIWYDRFVAEHPEVTAEYKENRKREVEVLEQKLVNLEPSYTALWAGIGIAGTGVLMTITGGILMGVYQNESVKYNGTNGQYQTARVSPVYTFSTIILGTGIGLMVSGGIVAGIVAIKNARVKAANEALTFDFGPAGMGMTYTF